MQGIHRLLLLTQGAGIRAHANHGLLGRRKAQAAFKIQSLAAAWVLVAIAIERSHCVLHGAACQLATGMHTPVRRSAELQAISQGVFDITHAVVVLGKRHPWQIGGTGAQHEGIAEFVLDVGLLQIHLGGGDCRGVLEVGSQIHRPLIVELVVYTQIEALDVEGETGLVGLHALAAVVDIGQVVIQAAAELGVVDQFLQ